MPADPKLALQLLTYALLGALVIAGYFAYLLNECRCGKCAFHVEARKEKAAKLQREAEEEQRKQEHFRHEYEHKGGAWLDGDPDRFNCSKSTCSRNRHGPNG